MDHCHCLKSLTWCASCDVSAQAYLSFMTAYECMIDNCELHTRAIHVHEKLTTSPCVQEKLRNHNIYETRLRQLFQQVIYTSFPEAASYTSIVLKNNWMFLGCRHFALLKAHQCKWPGCLWARQDTMVEQRASISLFRLLPCVCFLLPAPEFCVTGQFCYFADCSCPP